MSMRNGSVRREARGVGAWKHLFLFVLIIGAGPQGAKALSLADAYGMALDDDPAFRGALHQHRASGEAVTQARAGLLPDLTFSYEHLETSQDIVSSDNTVFQSGSSDFPTESYTLTLSQPLFNYASWMAYKQAGTTVERADADLDVERQELTFKVADLYFRALAAEDEVAFSGAEHTAVGRQLELTEQRLRLGLARITDAHDARARYAAVEASLIEARNTLDDARQALGEAIGVAPEALDGLKEEIPLIRPDPDAPEEWETMALRRNPELLGLELRVREMRQEVGKQKAGHYPTLDLVYRLNNRETSGSLFGGGSQVETGDLMVQFNLPLFKGLSTSSGTREAAELHQKAKQDLLQKQREIKRQTRAAYLGVISAASKVAALDKMVASQALALESKQRGFKSGLFTTLAVLDAERDLYRARRDYAQARYDYILNTLKLKRASGILAAEDIEKIDGWLE